jgi:hypothetical protein
MGFTEPMWKGYIHLYISVKYFAKQSHVAQDSRLVPSFATRWTTATAPGSP